MQLRNDVVISGISGYFPESLNTEEFKNILLGNVNVSGKARWKEGEVDVCNKTGNIPFMNFFDASYFGIHAKQTMFLDPMIRLALEKTFEAIIDAGLNPTDVRNKNIGVYFGSCLSETDCCLISPSSSGFGITGHCRTMLSNRISYWLNLKGPSSALDSGFTNGIQIIQCAMDAINRGECESAIVGATNIACNSTISWMYKEMGYISEHGVTKPFDENADGYMRSDGIVILFLQKAQDAKRHYASILHANVIFNGHHDKAVNDTDCDGLTNFLQECYNKSGVNPHDVQYLEAHGSGVKKIDEIEMSAVEEILCKNRKSALQIGSIKGNIGHSEASSALMSIIKVLIAMETGIIPATLSHKDPNINIPGFSNGKLKVVTNNTLWHGGIAAINSISMVSSYGHIILQSNPKSKQIMEVNIPMLYTFSTRTEKGILKICNELKSKSVDMEYSSLCHQVFSSNIPGHFYRGFVLKGSENIEEHLHLSGTIRPVWFVYSGMGSQWHTMGKTLMQIPVFARAIEKCHNVLVPKGLNLINILTENNTEMFDNIIYSFVGIAAVQIGLTDILTELNVIPDGIIGHSVGELGCAYADKCLTAEQMIISAYYRGVASQEADLIKGMMAAIGLGYQQLKEICPPSINISCHNGPESCTISGPVKDMELFVATLQSKGIFAKLVNVSNIAYHSQYIQPAGPLLLKYLQNVITHPKQRSAKWISTSVPVCEWTKDLAKSCSAEYLTNNLLSSVLFEEGLQFIPNDAILIEIAPHGLLQAILKRSLPTTCTNIPLTKKFHENILNFFLHNLGRLYINGANFNLTSLYPLINYPVSKGTKFLSTLSHWEHGEEWDNGFVDFLRHEQTEENILITLNNKEFRHLLNCQVDEQVLIPLATYLNLVYRVIDKANVTENILFKDIRMVNHCFVPVAGSVHLTIMVQVGSGYFEINNQNNIILSGIVSTQENFNILSLCSADKLNTNLEIYSKDFYNELEDRGYYFSDNFALIKSITITDNDAIGTVDWNHNWQDLINGLMQVFIYHEGGIKRTMILPSYIEQLQISFKTLSKVTEGLKYSYNFNTGILSTTGVKIKGVDFHDIPLSKKEFTAESTIFLNYHNEKIKDIYSVLNFCLKIIQGNLMHDTKYFQMYEMNNTDQGISKILKEAIKPYAFMQKNVIIVDSLNNNISNFSLLFSDRIPEVYFNSYDNYLLLYLPMNQKLNLDENSLTVIAKYNADGKNFYLIKKKLYSTFTIVSIDSEMLNTKHESVWFTKLQSALDKVKMDDRVYLISKILPIEGIKHFIQFLKKLANVEYLRTVFILDKNAPNFSDNKKFYQQIFQNDLIVSIYTNGNWGNYFTILNKVTTDEQCNNFGMANVLSSNLIVQNIGVNLFEFDKKFSKKCINYSALDNTGQRIMGISEVDNKLTEFCPDPEFMWPIPEDWSMADAATVPQAYLLAYYCLFEIGKLQKGDNIFINPGHTAFGRAAIKIASYYHCLIFTTVDLNIQRKRLKLHCPELIDEHIFNTNDAHFALHLQEQTQGRGVQIVLNSLPTDLQTCNNCLAEFGRLINISKSNMNNHNTIGMNFFLKSTSLYGIDPESILIKSNEIKKRLHTWMSNGILNGSVKPLGYTIMDSEHNPNDILEHSKDKQYFGSIVMNLLISNNHKISGADGKIKTSNLKGNEVCFVHGNITDIWIHVIEHLALNNVKNIVVASNTKDLSNQMRYKIILFEQYYNINIIMIDRYITNIKSAESIISTLKKYGELKCVYILPSRKPDNTEYFDFNVAHYVDVTLHVHFPKTVQICLIRNEIDKTYMNKTNSLVRSIKWEPQISIKDVFRVLNNNLFSENDIVIKYNKIEVQQKYHDIFVWLPESIEALTNIKYEPVEIQLINMPSKSSAHMKGIPPLFIVPGICGLNSSYLKEFAQSLMYPVYCVNFNSSQLNSNIKSAVAQKIKEIWPDSYNIIGISWGGLMAAEVAKELEDSGKIVQLFLIDGAVDTIKSYIISDQSSNFEEKLLIKLLNVYSEEVKNNNSVDLRGKVKQLLYKTSLKYDDTAILDALNVLRDRVEYGKLYEFTSDFINGMTHLLRPIHSNKQDSCGLTKICKNILIDVMNTEHQTMLQDLKLINYINENIIL